MEEVYECIDCSNCSFKSQCTKSTGNRRVTVNEEYTRFHKEVINNLESIQAEGAFWILKQDRGYGRIVIKGLVKVKLEVYMIAIGYNIYKYYNKLRRTK